LLSASACQNCPSYQRRPNKPVNAMLAFEQTEIFNIYKTIDKPEDTSPFSRTAFTG
jgi:hypothetical protein